MKNNGFAWFADMYMTAISRLKNCPTIGHARFAALTRAFLNCAEIISETCLHQTASLNREAVFKTKKLIFFFCGAAKKGSFF